MRPRTAPKALFVFTLILLVLVWIAFGKAAEKAARDRDDMLKYVE
jgi:cbb3-type cytochrome oxidase subunit 3